MIDFENMLNSIIFSIRFRKGEINLLDIMFISKIRRTFKVNKKYFSRSSMTDLSGIRKTLVSDRYFGSRSARVTNIAEDVYLALQDVTPCSVAYTPPGS